MRMKNFIINDYLSFKITVVALFVALISTSALAGMRGEPCIQVIDLGAPEYLDRKALLERLPVKLGLFGYKGAKGNIRRVVEGTAADEAGLLAGDKIRGIREKDTGLVKTDRFQVGRVYVFDITRDSVSLEIDVEYKSVDKSVDPVSGIFSRLIEDGIKSCHYEAISPPPLPHYAFLKKQLSQYKEFLIDSKGRFKCYDAHIELGNHSELSRHDGDDNTVFFIRGGRRVIFSMPHWGTMCLTNDSLNTPEKIEKSFSKFKQRILNDYLKLLQLKDP